MVAGHCFTIEPCVVQGDEPLGRLWEDGWTMVTRVSGFEPPLGTCLQVPMLTVSTLGTQSGARSTQFEHQVLITEQGVDVLTRLD